MYSLDNRIQHSVTYVKHSRCLNWGTQPALTLRANKSTKTQNRVAVTHCWITHCIYTSPKSKCNILTLTCRAIYQSGLFCCLVLEILELFLPVKKNPFTTVGQIKNTLQGVDVSVSKSTIKRKLHQSKQSSPQDVNYWWASITGRSD